MMRKKIGGKKLTRKSPRSESGAILPIVIILMLALTIIGLAFLNAGVMENSLVRTEIAKTQAFYLAEAGIVHLKVKLHAGENEPHISWTNLGDGDYEVEGFYSEDPPYAISTGRIIKDGQEIRKRIRIRIHKTTVFDFGVFGDMGGILMTGNAKVYSYNSDDPSFPSHEASMGTNSIAENIIELTGNAQANGDAFVGPGGDTGTAIKLTGNAEITGNQRTLSEEKELPEVTVPEGLPDRGTLTVSGNNTVYVNQNGQYSSISVQGNGKLIIVSDCTLAVGILKVSGNGKIRITNNADVSFYVTDRVLLSGNAITNESQNPSHLNLYGTDSCTQVKLGGNTDFYGAVYARNATITCTGNGDIYGSVVGNRVEVTGNGDIHWDAALMNDPSAPGGIALEDWEELS
jgi:hypothetical protein